MPYTHTHTHTHTHTQRHTEWGKYIYTHTQCGIYIYTHTMDYYSAIQKNEMPFSAIWMDLEIITVSKVRKR